jgi:quercetin dioxygenase-like cupin family protein
MKILRFDERDAEEIGERPFVVQGVSGLHLGEGGGDAHCYVMHFRPGGLIGPHEAGFGQLFVALDGSGWVAGDDGERRAIAQGEAAFVARGEIHSKGSDSGLTALMIQVRDLSV